MGRGSTSWDKRQREKAKRERKQAKRMRRDERRDADPSDPAAERSQEELMAEFAELGQRHAQGRISDQAFEDARVELFAKMGIQVGVPIG